MNELMSEWYAWDNEHLYPVEGWVREDNIVSKVIIYGVFHNIHDFTFFEVNLN